MTDSSNCCVKLNYITEQQANKVNPWTIEDLVGESSKCVLKTTSDQRKKADFKVISSLLLAYGFKVYFK